MSNADGLTSLLSNLPILLDGYKKLKKWIVGRKILFKILPSGQIDVPVDGRCLTILISNRSKRDLNVKVTLRFPKYCNVYKVAKSDCPGEDEEIGGHFEMDEDWAETEAISDAVTVHMQEDEEVSEFNEELMIPDGKNLELNFLLIPKNYGKKDGYILYELVSEWKSEKGKILVIT